MTQTSTHRTPVLTLALADDPSMLPYLPLGMITAYLRTFNAGTLANSYDIRRIQAGGITNYPLSDLQQQIATEQRCIILLSSYVWNNVFNMAAAREFKALNPNARIIVGGPEVPKYVNDTERFLQENPFIDIAVLGEGEVACAEILQKLSENEFRQSSLSEVTGIVFRDGENTVRTEDRSRVRDLDTLPSPYLTGEFDDWFLTIPTAILETNRGCPFGCTYCDWGSATLEKVSKFEIQRVKDEIEYIGQKQCQSVFIADANFGMLEQDIDFARALVETKARYGYPKRVYTNFAKNGGHRLMSVIKLLHEGGLLETGIIALQTTDANSLEAIKRDNIKTSSYEELMGYFNAEKIPMASDIMIGLPGQTVDSLQTDLQFCFDWKVSANGNYTSMMPNAPMAEQHYREQYAIEVDDDGLIASTSTFSKTDLYYMKSLYMVYQFHVCLGTMKYYLYFLQLEHQVPAIALIRKWLDAILAQDTSLPVSRRVYAEMFRMESRSGDWAVMDWGDEARFLFDDFESYFDEFHAFAVRSFGLEIHESVVESMRLLQAGVMPKIGRDYPHIIEPPNDLKHYFRKMQKTACINDLRGKWPPLHKYPPGKVFINPVLGARRTLKFAKRDGHTDGWELPSSVRFYRPTAR